MTEYTIFVNGLPLVTTPDESIFKAIARFVAEAESKEWGAFQSVKGSVRGIFVKYEGVRLMIRPTVPDIQAMTDEELRDEAYRRQMS